MQIAAGYLLYKFAKSKESKTEKPPETTTAGPEETKETAKAKEAADLIESFHCPITQQLMVEPVSSKYGHTYEKAAIERWVAKYHTCPMTN